MLILYDQAREQRGVVTRAQAIRAGLSQAEIDGRTERGEWERLFPGVYRFASNPPSWEQRVFAARLWAGRTAAVSHRAAARLWELSGVEDATVEITTGRHLRAPGVRVHRSKLPRGHVTKVDGIRTTTAARTLLDLGAVAAPSVVEAALDDALHRRLTSIAKLTEVLQRSGGPGRAGTATLRRLLSGRDPELAPPESLLEARLAKVLAASLLPPAVAQLEVRDGSRLLGRVDFAWPDALVALEADGFRFHGDAAAWRRDLARGNRLTSRGWRVLHVTWDDVMQRPEEVIESVAAALGC